MEFTFKIGSKIKEAWPIYKKHFYTFLLLTIITGVIQMIGGEDNFILIAISYIVGLIVTFVWIKFALSLIDGKDYNPFSKEALPTVGQFWKLFKTMVLYSLCVLGGIILLIIPGFYISGRLIFSAYLSIEKNQGARVTIKEAWDMTKGYGWKLFWKGLVIGMFIILGFIVLFLGIFITYPLGILVFAMMYREFSKIKFPKNENNENQEAPIRDAEVKENVVAV